MALPYDIKHSFAGKVLGFVHDSYAGFLHQELRYLLNQQERLTGQRGYLFGFRAYTDKHMGKPVNDLPPEDRPVATLPAGLVDEHYAWVNNLAEHDLNIRRISQGITSILLRAETRQHLRDLLPDHVLGPALQHSSINGLVRVDPPLYHASPAEAEAACWDTKLFQLYADIAPLLDTYLRYTLL